MQTIERNVLATLISVGGQISLRNFAVVYESMTGTDLYYEIQYESFKELQQFFEEKLSHVCKLDFAANNDITISAILNEDVQHLAPHIHKDPTETKPNSAQATHAVVGMDLERDFTRLCEDHGLPAPEVKIIKRGEYPACYYCMIKIGNEKFTSYPALCAEEALAKKVCIQKATEAITGVKQTDLSAESGIGRIPAKANEETPTEHPVKENADEGCPKYITYDTLPVVDDTGDYYTECTYEPPW